MMNCQGCGKRIRYGDSSVMSIENGKRKLLCQSCYDAKMQAKRDEVVANNFLSHHLSRTRKLGLRSDLTLDEWNETKRYFENRCAYCSGDGQLSVEHFVPVVLGGGTTRSNCVPACDRCNHLKHYRHPDLVVSIPKKDMERIREYLARFE